MKKSCFLFLIFICPLFAIAQNYIIAEPRSMAMGYEKFIGQSYDIKYHKLYINVNPGSGNVNGYVVSRFIPLSNADTMDFDAHNCLTIDSVIYHGNEVTFSHSNNRLLITGLSLMAQNLDSIIVYYHGTPVASGFGSFYSSTQWLWTLSEPFGAADWWPCKNDLSDKIDSIDICIEHPSSYVAVANGLEKSSIDLGNSRKLTHWQHRYPIAAYLVAIAVAPYQYFNTYVTLQDGALRIDNYVLSSEYNNAQNAMTNFTKVIKFYDSLIAPYPFMNERYGHAHFGWGGGMEHQTISFVGSFDYELLAHELLHQWFGDAVTCGSWHDIWLNEGFATYFTALSQEKFFPQDFTNWKNYSLNFITYIPCGSVYVYDTTSVDRIFSSRLSYRKAAYVLHMLRWILGDNLFFDGIREYYETYKYSYAMTEDFKSIMEQAADTSLTEFFNDWIYGEGYPIYTFYVNEIDDNSFSITIHQQSSCTPSTFFEMPLPFLLSYTSANDTTIILNNINQDQEFIINLPMPDNITFDPLKWILTVNSTIIVDIQAYKNLNLTVYPNPAYDLITIENPNKKDFTLSFTDLLTKNVIFNDHIAANTSKTLDISNISPGSYLLTFQTGKNQIITKKIIKQ
jgi:aminopeptidase N